MIDPFTLAIVVGFWGTLTVLLAGMKGHDKAENSFERRFKREVTTRGMNRWWEDYKARKGRTHQ
jgi:hypothetical protein